MKTFGKLNFGVQAVQAGQKNATVNATPQLVASSTPGKFSVTAPVSKALNIAVGENIMFLNNITAVESAIQSKNEDVMALAAEYGIDINTKSGEDALIAELSQWYIAKGVLQYNSKGEPVMASERYTREDKIKYLNEHRMELVDSNREALIAEFGELSDDELSEKLTVDMISSPKYHSASGSKTSATGNTTGVGCQLSFTDSSIWHSLKKDLGDNASRKTRIYDVVLADAQQAEFNNGKENISVTILPIVFKEDVDPVNRLRKAE